MNFTDFLMVVSFYLALVFAGSVFRQVKEVNCYKDFPIDYVLYTKLFCEIKK